MAKENSRGLFLRIRILKLQKAQEILLNEMDKQLTDYENNILKDVDISPMRASDLIKMYIKRLQKICKEESDEK